MNRDDSSSTPLIVGSGKFTFQDPAGISVGLPNDMRKRQSMRKMCQNSNLLRFLSTSALWRSDTDADADSETGVRVVRFGCCCCCCCCSGSLGLSVGVSSTVKYPSAFDIRHAWPNAFQDRSVLQPSKDIEIY